ncbi:MAG: MtnX-like HAD-IB family phosphatase [Chloroflexi bacterium]|nr:MtnX-like HAD-IB family phosphatase [Chloroflexota bacterium]
MSQGTNKTLIQCDFDGTITIEDVSFALLDAFADGDWRQILREHEQGKMTVGEFNSRAFALVKAPKESLLKVANGNIEVRPGFDEMLSYCRRKDFRFVVVSNGLDFYIREILRKHGAKDIEVYAAKTWFHPDCLKVQYIGPDGTCLDRDFKVAYVNSFLQEDYRIIYMGNGTSDIEPAKQCRHIFATGNLLNKLKQTNHPCTPFEDFHEVVKVLEQL